jgi:CheY-like chemotaxis protein
MGRGDCVGSWAGRDILVVDDEDDIREPLAAVLELHGYQVRTAVNGRDALEALTRAIPDWILLDLTMPEMDGLEFIDTVRQRDLFSSERIIVISASRFAPPPRSPRLRALSKPFTIAEVLAAIQGER